MQASKRTQEFNESVIREMTRHAYEYGAINLSQGYPDFDPPQEVIEAAVAAIRGDVNQYTVTWGYPPLRTKLAKAYSPKLDRELDPDVHITVTCGVTEGIVAAMQAVANPGDEVLVLEPAHENFRPAAIMAGARAVPVALTAPDYRLSRELLTSKITPKTKALLINTPHNPTGRVFDDEEMAALVEVVVENDLILITDEIYEHILYDGRVHVSPARHPDLKDRTIVVGGMSKTFAITGWRLGFVFAPDALATGVRRAHDFMTICAPTPLQAAAVTALDLPESYYTEMTAAYHQRRDTLMDYLAEAGFKALMPQGAYYTIADYRGLAVPQAKLADLDFAMWMTKEVGVAVVPMSSFYRDPALGEGSVRFAFPKKLETLRVAGERLLAIR
jgi:aspartate/methionine/tyrosine aminotransferase